MKSLTYTLIILSLLFLFSSSSKSKTSIQTTSLYFPDLPYRPSVDEIKNNLLIPSGLVRTNLDDYFKLNIKRFKILGGYAEKEINSKKNQTFFNVLLTLKDLNYSIKYFDDENCFLTAFDKNKNEMILQLDSFRDNKNLDSSLVKVVLIHFDKKNGLNNSKNEKIISFLSLVEDKNV